MVRVGEGVRKIREEDARVREKGEIVRKMFGRWARERE